MMIRAMAAAGRGEPLEEWSYETGAPGPHDCRLEVLSCGLCHSDVHMIDDDWKISRYPLVPGHEVVGLVEEVGSQVRHLVKGDRVGVGWQRAACLGCADCLRGDENLCNDSKSVIGDGYGGFADRLVVDSRFAFRVPDGIETDVAGPLFCAGVTVYSALRHAGMTSGRHVGVIGVGGLGHLAIQYAAKLGNRVTAFTTSRDKEELCMRMGAHDVVVTEPDVPPASARPLDILINTAPANLDWKAYLELLASDGTLTFVGVPLVPLEIPGFSLLLKRRRITASPIGGRAIMSDMLQVSDTFGIAPVIEVFPLARVNEAIEKVRRNTIRYRAVITRSGS